MAFVLLSRRACRRWVGQFVPLLAVKNLIFDAGSESASYWFDASTLRRLSLRRSLDCGFGFGCFV